MRRVPVSLIKPGSSGKRSHNRELLLLAVALTVLRPCLCFARHQNPLASFRGRVVDETGKAISGARVSLYIQTGRWEHRDILVRRISAGTDGSFAFQRPPDLHRSGTTSPNRGFILLADHSDHAVGWRMIAQQARSFEADLILSLPVERPFTVTDDKGQPFSGAVVLAYGLGDPSSARADFRDPLELRVDEGPLTTVTDSHGHATLGHLPRTSVSFIARAPGFAPTYAFRAQDRFRLTRSASLAGTLQDENGRPLPNVTVVLKADFMWQFERAKTGANGAFHFDDLMASGWDMSAWRQGMTGNGTYAIRIESPDHALENRSIALAPGAKAVQNLRARPATRLAVKVVGRETGKPVSDIRVQGFGPTGDLDGRTDARGVVVFATLHGNVQVFIAGVPAGFYVDGDVGNAPGASIQGTVRGETAELTLTMPPLAGPLLQVAGVCLLPDGKPPTPADVYPSAGRFQTAGSISYIRHVQVESSGAFTLHDVPSGRKLALYAETRDGKFAGYQVVQSPAGPDPAFRPVLKLRNTVKVVKILKNKDGKGLAARKFSIEPKVGDDWIVFHRREVSTDRLGRIEFTGIVPGLIYHVSELVDPGNQQAAFRVLNDVYDQRLVLSPDRPK